jgi:hypothetical protein
MAPSLVVKQICRANQDRNELQAVADVNEGEFHRDDAHRQNKNERRSSIMLSRGVDPKQQDPEQQQRKHMAQIAEKVVRLLLIPLRADGIETRLLQNARNDRHPVKQMGREKYGSHGNHGDDRDNADNRIPDRVTLENRLN